MARPGKGERARRQGLAADRRAAQEQERLDAEEREQETATAAHATWHAEEEQAMAAAEDAAYADRAVKALDELASLLASCEESGDLIDPGEVREILAGAGHPDFLPDPGWCGTGL